MATDEEHPSLKPLATCQPHSPVRAWLTHPHPYLPLLATASSDKVIRIYSLTSFTLLTSITGGHKRSIRTCAWKPGIRGERESILATGSFDANAGIWKAENAKLGMKEGELSGFSGEFGDREGGEEEDDEEFRFAVVLEGHESEIKSVAWSCNGTFLATCSRDKSVWIWETLDSDPGAGGDALGAPADDDDNLETVAVLQEHEGDVKCVAWHPTEENCLASGSYDEYIRIWREDLDGEWSCVGVCEGHDGTVWCVDWEPPADASKSGTIGEIEIKPDTEEKGAVSGPRIISCSADLSIRLWKRKPKEKRQDTGPRIPSIIRSSIDDEEWYEEGRLPQRHDRAVYAVAWSKTSRRVVSCGSDGKIVVYAEEEHTPTVDTEMSGTQNTETAGDKAATNGVTEQQTDKSSWRVVFETDAAHGVYEINHVCWARRRDRGKRADDEEVIVSTGDDGEVKVWTLDDR